MLRLRLSVSQFSEISCFGSGMEKPWIFKNEKLFFFIFEVFWFFDFLFSRFLNVENINHHKNLKGFDNDSTREVKRCHLSFWHCAQSTHIKFHYINIIYITSKKFWTILKIALWKTKNPKFRLFGFFWFFKKPKNEKTQKPTFASLLWMSLFLH